MTIQPDLIALWILDRQRLETSIPCLRSPQRVAAKIESRRLNLRCRAAIAPNRPY